MMRTIPTFEDVIRMTPKLGLKISPFGIIEDIQNVLSFNQTLSKELKMVIKSTQKTLKIRTERLKLKNQKFKCIEPAILKEINGLFEILGEKINNTITQNGTFQNKLRTYVDLQKFIKSHCLI
ncbi:hypothetical protein GLOIN_2v1772385 [Rhizophagus irregularis DAOM 181602=DAOM 197198]|nr:hypothetical protein GLOIN_2v1772385 [Rhizophagus irregularis DAOM 181602=DAOM 197198]